MADLLAKTIEKLRKGTSVPITGLTPEECSAILEFIDKLEAYIKKGAK